MKAIDFEVLREIHAPGLDLNQDRMTKHRLFMGVVHDQLDRIGAFAWKHFEKEGRGAVFVNKRQWMEAIREKNWDRAREEILPFAYAKDGAASVGLDVDVLGKGYAEMLSAYDAETSLVLLVQHPPGEMLSAYLLLPTLSPQQAYTEFVEMYAAD